jgi:hypothetical protein
MNLSLSMDIEAALYNERTLTWEPFIEPVIHKSTGHLTPWNMTCSIKPVSQSIFNNDFIDLIRCFRIWMVENRGREMKCKK